MIPLSAMQSPVCEMHQPIQTDFSLSTLDTEHHGGRMPGSPDQIYITPTSQPPRGDGISADAKRRASQLLRDGLDRVESRVPRRTRRSSQSHNLQFPLLSR